MRGQAACRRGQRHDALKACVTGGADNRSTPAVQQKGMSTKWPLMAVQMQMTPSLLDVNKQMKLVWRPREESDEADALTNGEFAKFNPEKRIKFRSAIFPWSCSTDYAGRVTTSWRRRRGFLWCLRRQRLSAKSRRRRPLGDIWAVDGSPFGGGKCSPSTGLESRKMCSWRFESRNVPTQFLEKLTVVLCVDMSFTLCLLQVVVGQIVNMFVIPSLDVRVSCMEV